MAMQVEHKTEKGTVLFLKIENDYSIAGLNDGHIYFWTSSLLQSMGDYPLCVDIPKGNYWQLIGLTSEITEEQAKVILGEGENLELATIWQNFISHESPYWNALDSFKSLMHHLQVYEVNPFASPAYPKAASCENDYVDARYEQNQYDKAQENVGKWVVVFKSN